MGSILRRLDGFGVGTKPWPGRQRRPRRRNPMPERRSTRREQLARRLARLKRWEASSSGRDFTDDVTRHSLKRWRRREARHKPVDAAELQLCRENPELAGTIAGFRYVRCLECGRDFEELGSHLYSAHEKKTG